MSTYHDMSGDPPVQKAATSHEVYIAGGIEELREVLNHINAGIVAHAPDTTIRVCNPMACEILGLTMDQMIGTAVPDPQWMFVREDGSRMPIEEYPAVVVLTSKSVLKNLVVGVHRPATGDVRWVLVNGFPVLDGDGELQQAIISFIDITSRQQAIAEKAALEEQLRQAQKMEAIGRLAGGIAHDFNNLLTGILGYSELVLLDLDPDSVLHVQVREIQKSGKRAAELTNQLLAFARKQIVTPKVIQANDVLRHSERMVRRLIGEDIELIFRPAKHLHSIRCDPGQLDQILVNLAVNARDAMPTGGKLTIETENITLENAPDAGGDLRSGAFVMLAVSDVGEGMDSETKARIFEPFFSTKHKNEGTGLGLATVYGIVKQAGGFINVYSEIGVGSTFKIYFPAVSEEPEPITPGVTSSDTPTGVETILLVEDDQTVRELARKMLTAHGYTVLEAGDADEAEMLCSRYSGDIDLVLSDVVMPKCNGLEMFDVLSVLRPGLAVLFMSGYTENVIAHHGILEPGTNFLRKPFTLRALTRTVRDVLDVKHPKR